MKIQSLLMLLIITILLISCKNQDSIEERRIEQRKEPFTPKTEIDSLNVDALDLFISGSDKEEKEAISLLEKALTIDSTSRMTVLNLSRLYINRGNYAKSATILDNWLSSNSEDVIIRLEYALILLCMDKLEEASIQLEKCSIECKSKFEQTKEDDYLIGVIHSLVLLDKEEAIKTIIKDYKNSYPEIIEYTKELDKSELLPC